MGTGSGSPLFSSALSVQPTPERWTRYLEYSSFSSAYGLDGITIINLSLCQENQKGAISTYSPEIMCPMSMALGNMCLPARQNQ